LFKIAKTGFKGKDKLAPRPQADQMPERHRVILNLHIRLSFTLCRLTQEEGLSIHWMRSCMGSTDNFGFLAKIEILKSSSP
jgi:hypothetical protein